MNYSFLKGLLKAVTNALIFIVPLAVTVLPQEWMNVTLSGALYMLVNYLKVSQSK